jgi:hypothetical protein
MFVRSAGNRTKKDPSPAKSAILAGNGTKLFPLPAVGRFCPAVHEGPSGCLKIIGPKLDKSLDLGIFAIEKHKQRNHERR